MVSSRSVSCLRADVEGEFAPLRGNTALLVSSGMVDAVLDCVTLQLVTVPQGPSIAIQGRVLDTAGECLWWVRPDSPPGRDRSTVWGSLVRLDLRSGETSVYADLRVRLSSATIGAVSAHGKVAVSVIGHQEPGAPEPETPTVVHVYTSATRRSGRRTAAA